jgi:hypothetical protein
MRIKSKIQVLGASWIFLTVLVACDTGENQSQVVYQSNAPNTPTDLIRYEREGGGQSSFTIADSVTYYNIHFTGLMGNRDTTLELLKSTVSSNVNAMLEGLYSGSQRISGTLYSTGLTGTWNYVYIQVVSGWIRVGNQYAINALEPLEMQVDSIIYSY